MDPKIIDLITALASLLLAALTGLLAFATFNMAKGQTTVTTQMVEEAKKQNEEFLKERLIRIKPFIEVTRAFAQIKWSEDSGKRISKTIVYLRVRNVKQEPALDVRVIPPSGFQTTDDHLRIVACNFEQLGSWDLVAGYTTNPISSWGNPQFQIRFRDIEENSWAELCVLSLSASKAEKFKHNQANSPEWIDFDVSSCERSAEDQDNNKQSVESNYPSSISREELKELVQDPPPTDLLPGKNPDYLWKTPHNRLINRKMYI